MDKVRTDILLWEKLQKMLGFDLPDVEFACLTLEAETSPTLRIVSYANPNVREDIEYCIMQCPDGFTLKRMNREVVITYDHCT